MPKAISYMRFSAIHQGKGSTLDRQQQLIDKWFEQHPDIEKSSLSVTDKGKSAYKGDHLNHGLGMILAAIASGEIKSGDYILVEAIDRIGRLEPTDMVELINGIVKAGVTIVTLEDNTEYTKKTLNDGMGALFILVGKVQQAHEYSKTLSRRITNAYETKRINARQGVPIKLSSPFWLGSGGKLIPANAEAVRSCIDLYLKGRGAHSILRDLVTVHPVLEPIHATTLKRWFLSRALIGEWQNQGDHIPSVFEPLIDEVTFYRLQKEVKSRIRGARPEQSYELSGLVKCSNCGGNYHFRRKHHADYVIQYANCSTYLKRGKRNCDNFKTWPYEILMVLFEQSYRECLYSVAMGNVNASIDKEVGVLRERLSEVNGSIDRLLEILVEIPEQRNTKDKIFELNHKKESIEKEIRTIEQGQGDVFDLGIDELNAVYEKMDADPIYRRGLLTQAGYSIDGRDQTMRVKVGPAGEIVYTLVKRSTKYKCYFVEEYTPTHSLLNEFTGEYDDFPAETVKMAINRDGVMCAAIVDTWDELFA